MQLLEPNGSSVVNELDHFMSICTDHRKIHLFSIEVSSSSVVVMPLDGREPSEAVATS